MDSETLEEKKPEDEAEEVVPASEETEKEGGKAKDDVAGEKEAGGDRKAEGEGEGEKKEDETEQKKNKRKVGEVGGGRKRGKREEEMEEEKMKPEGEEGEKKLRKRKPSVVAEPATPVERPARDRKRVERYSAPAEKSLPAGKSLEIKKGRGTQLKDIPNVAFKFSKRKTDDTLLTLHSILFGKKSTKYYVKRNLSQFSGFVWGEDKERQRAKVKEKLDKCVKDKLLDFCDVLDIHVTKATIKKEELSVKLMEFLESPHPTTEVLLAEKEQKRKKRARKAKGEELVERSKKRRKKSPDASSMKKGQQVQDEEEDELESNKSPSDNEEDAAMEVKSESLKGESESEEEEREPQEASKQKQGSRPKGKEKLSTVKKNSPSDSRKSSLKPPLKKAASSDEDDEAKDEDGGHMQSESDEDVQPDDNVESKKGSKKQSNITAPKRKEKTAKDPVVNSPSKLVSKKGASADPSVSGRGSASKSKEARKVQKRSKKDDSTKDKKATKKQVTKVSAKESRGKGKSGKARLEPNREEMLAVVRNILKEVDFNTATLSDILRQLGDHFEMDLMHRKVEVKGIIEEVINNMTDDEEGEENDEEAEDHEGKDGDA